MHRILLILAAVAALPLSADERIERLMETPWRPGVGDDGPSRGVPVLRVGNDPSCDFTASPSINGLQQAIDAAASDANGAAETEIRLANTGQYVNRRFFINDLADQTVRLVGGFVNCASAGPTGARTVLDRGTASAGPVLLIDQVASLENVFLENLELRGGSGSAGGGMEIRNNNFVIATDVRTTQNSASSGGGIAVGDTNDGTQTLLWLLGDSDVTANTATAFGGGISCSGAQASMVIDTDVSVSGNSTAISGGGLSVRSGCVADVYASFPDGIYENSAGTGGGIAASNGGRVNVVGGEQGFFGFGDADRRTTVDGNTATENGGGLFVTGAGTLVRMTDAVLRVNRADDDGDGDGSGGGAWVGSMARLEIDRTLDDEACHSVVRCSDVAGNSAVQGGGIFVRGNGTEVDVRQTWFTLNSASDSGAALYSTLAGGELPPDSVDVYLEGNVFTGHPMAGNAEVVTLNFGNDARLVYNTFAGNADSEFDSAVFLNTSNNVDFFGNLVAESPGRVFSGIWGSPSFPNIGSAACVVAHEIASLPPGSTDSVAADAMLDGGLRPTGVSPAVDFCDAATYPILEPDLENLPRGVDTAGVTNGLGPFDLGALEFRGTIDGGEVAFIDLLVEMNEGDPARTLLLRRTGAAQGEARIRVQTVAGSAMPGSDFAPIDTVVTWADGDNLPKSVVLGLVDDGVGEDRERLTIQLSIDGGTGTLGAPSTLPVTIYDDDAGVFADGFEGPGSL
ncbi:Calx-beta domain-containing protein [Halomonas denitrificans]|nr:hypothetical protein [Halomonas denitrificans]